jgi:hypothetical protein
MMAMVQHSGTRLRPGRLPWPGGLLPHGGNHRYVARIYGWPQTAGGTVFMSGCEVQLNVIPKQHVT